MADIKDKTRKSLMNRMLNRDTPEDRKAIFEELVNYVKHLSRERKNVIAVLEDMKSPSKDDNLPIQTVYLRFIGRFGERLSYDDFITLVYSSGYDVRLDNRVKGICHDGD